MLWVQGGPARCADGDWHTLLLLLLELMLLLVPLLLQLGEAVQLRVLRGWLCGVVLLCRCHCPWLRLRSCCKLLSCMRWCRGRCIRR